MSTTKTCTRCKADVPDILGPPPGDRDFWWRNQIGMTRHRTTWVLRLKVFRLRWLPENPHDQVSQTYTTLDLCDECAAAVFMFAQNLPSNRDGLLANEAPR